MTYHFLVPFCRNEQSPSTANLNISCIVVDFLPSPGRYFIALGHGRHNVLLSRIESVIDEHETSWVKCERLLDGYMARKHVSEWPVDGSNPSWWATISCSQYVSKNM